MKFSIVVAFKNRDEVRAKNFFDSLLSQTFKDFEVILVNYGSHDEYNSWVEKLPLRYAFLACIHTHTQGYLWNKSNALNIGIKQAQGEYVVVGDIDLVYRPDYLAEINHHLKPGIFITHNVYYLPENFSFKSIDELVSAKYNEQFYDGFHSACVLPREILLQIKGYDEFYMVWGVEDDDIIRSLIKANQKQIHFIAAETNIYHQWHRSVSPGNPRPWYLLMVDHLFSVKRDEHFGLDWGDITQANQRPVLAYLQHEKYKQTTQLNFWEDQTLLFFNPFIEGFHKISAGETGFISFPFIEPKKPKKESWFKKSVDEENADGISNKDITQFFHFFIGSHSGLLQDYFFSEDNGMFLFVFVKN